ncbi:MAG: thylakoid membrane photosystem I accumulation factor [Thermostichales cyanobacterium BF4_bins_65]
MNRHLCWLLITLLAWLGLSGSPSLALLNDDHYDGNIFALYGSNGGMVPPRTTLEASQKYGRPVLLVYYIDDSRDCKPYAAAIANLQVRYGAGINVLPYNVDSLDLRDPQGPGRFYKGQVPQTLLFDGTGRLVYESVGNRPLEEVENAVRQLFNLPPVKPGQLIPQPFNEVQTGYGAKPLQGGGRRARS